MIDKFKRFKKLTVCVLVCALVTGVLAFSGYSSATKIIKQDKLRAVEIPKGICIPLTVDYVNIRKSPSSSGEVTGRMFKNTSAEILDGAENEWIHVRSGSITGYVNSNYVVKGSMLRKLVNSTLDERNLVVQFGEVVGGYIKKSTMESDTFSYITQAKPRGKVYATAHEGKYQEENVSMSLQGCVVVDTCDTYKDLVTKEMGEPLYAGDVVVIKNLGVDGYIETDAGFVEESDIEVSTSTKKNVDNIVDGDWGWSPIIGYNNGMYELEMGYANEVEIRNKSTCKAKVLFDAGEKLTVTEYAPKYMRVLRDGEEYYVSNPNYTVSVEFGDAVSTVDYTNDTHGDPNYSDARYYSYDYEDGTGGADVKRDRIVKYALRFLGNPYVWGGTSLTSGADCSGFVQSVHRHFGIRIGRTTSNQCGESKGKVVSRENLIPGDLIYYTKNGMTPHHVVMYIGNGKCVEASCRAYGICVRNVRWGKVLKIKDYIGTKRISNWKTKKNKATKKPVKEEPVVKEPEAEVTEPVETEAPVTPEVTPQPVEAGTTSEAVHGGVEEGNKQ